MSWGWGLAGVIRRGGTYLKSSDFLVLCLLFSPKTDGNTAMRSQQHAFLPLVKSQYGLAATKYWH